MIPGLNLIPQIAEPRADLSEDRRAAPTPYRRSSRSAVRAEEHETDRRRVFRLFASRRSSLRRIRHADAYRQAENFLGDRFDAGQMRAAAGQRRFAEHQIARHVLDDLRLAMRNVSITRGTTIWRSCAVVASLRGAAVERFHGKRCSHRRRRDPSRTRA